MQMKKDEKDKKQLIHSHFNTNLMSFITTKQKEPSLNVETIDDDLLLREAEIQACPVVGGAVLLEGGDQCKSLQFNQVKVPQLAKPPFCPWS